MSPSTSCEASRSRPVKAAGSATRQAVLGDIIVLGPRLSRPANAFPTFLVSFAPSGVTSAASPSPRVRGQFENIGAQMVCEVASKTSHVAGVVTTTATVLAQAIVREGGRRCHEPSGT